MSLKQAVNELGVELTVDECEKVFKRQEFQEIYLQELNRHRASLANAPGRDKSAAIGIVLTAIEHLIQENEWEKVVAAVEKLSKLEGWLGADSNINVYAGLSAKDIAEAKARILQEIDQDPSREPGESKTILPN